MGGKRFVTYLHRPVYKKTSGRQKERKPFINACPAPPIAIGAIRDLDAKSLTIPEISRK
jgi:hypothetical protein